MCNPRRVRVRATRELAATWEREVRRRVTRSGRAVGTARVVEPLGQSVGGPALAALGAVLGRSEQWEWRDDAFHHALDGGSLVYHPDTRSLEIIAYATEEVSATGEAAATVRGRTEGTVEAQGEGVYYDDGYRGTTESSATADARRNAERELDSAAARRIADEQLAAERREGRAVASAAAARAEEELARVAARRGEQLHGAAAARLDRVGVQARNLFHRVLAEAYRDAVLAYARSRQATGLVVREQDGVLDIEFEIEA